MLCCQVRTQHANRCVDFLSRELRVCTPKEAEERIFFISAKEALLTRMREREKPVTCEAIFIYIILEMRMEGNIFCQSMTRASLVYCEKRDNITLLERDNVS